MASNWNKFWAGLGAIALASTLSLPAFALPAASLDRAEVHFTDVPVREGAAVQASFFVAASPEVARAVLWDHERYPEFMPNSRWVKVLERKGDSEVVEMGGGHGPVTLTMVTERHLLRDRVTWRTLRSGEVRKNEGAWIFTAVEGGTLVTYQIHVVPALPVPAYAVAFLQKQALPAMIAAVRARIERLALKHSPRGSEEAV